LFACDVVFDAASSSTDGKRRVESHVKVKDEHRQISFHQAPASQQESGALREVECH
jgi:hypothetical protein